MGNRGLGDLAKESAKKTNRQLKDQENNLLSKTSIFFSSQESSNHSSNSGIWDSVYCVNGL